MKNRLETDAMQNPVQGNGLNMAVMAFAPDFTVMSLNQAARLLLGCDPLPGERYPLERVFDPRDSGSARHTATRVLDTGQPSPIQTGLISNHHGRQILCEYAAHPIFDKGRCIIGVIFNIQGVCPDESVRSQDPRSMETARCSPDFQSVFEDLPEGVFTIDMEYRVTSFNLAAEIITGFKRGEVLGCKCWEIFQADQCRKACPMASALNTGRTYFDQEVVTLDRHGRRRTLMVNVNAVKDKHGRLMGAVETFRAGPTLNNLSSDTDCFAGVVGRSQAMHAIFEMLPDIAQSEASVLIQGETGTGKDMVARAIHKLSPKKSGPFVAVNCAALAESLLESELFGHEKGAFTGADRTRPGRFEMARNGTLLLDEIGELKPDLQVKLLRVLEQRAFEPVGSTRTIPLRARIISATHRQLNKLLSQGFFREDLYYRLKTVPITIPPLRERPEDIPPLVKHFIEKFNDRFHKKVRAVDPKVMRFFERYHWPGNVRELERTIEHAFVFVKGPVIFHRNLPNAAEFTPSLTDLVEDCPVGDNNSRDTILWALSQTNGKRKQAAELLGISRTSMWRRMKGMGLS